MRIEGAQKPPPQPSPTRGEGARRARGPVRTHQQSSCLRKQVSHFKQLRVTALDLFGTLLDAFGILLHQLDLGERADAGLLYRLLVRRILAGEIDDDLLAF